jgi:oxygen-dependent protoporphyrinogen oxidase
MGLEYFLPRGKTDADESLAHFVRRRFGQEALERLVQPLVGGIYTADPERLSLKATMSRFLEMERTYGSVIRGLRQQKKTASRDSDTSASGARYGMFVSLAGGIDSLLTTLRQRVADRATIRTQTAVSAIALHSEGGYLLTLPGGAQERFDAVVLAIPAYRIADMVQNFSPETAADLRKIEYASTAIVISGHKLSDIAHPLDAFGLVVPAIERRKILAVSFTSRKFPGRAPEGRIILRTFVGGAMQPELLRQSDEEIQRMVRGELEQILGLRGTPDFSIVARWDRAMPQYHVGHVELVSRIEESLEKHPGLALAGNAWHGVGIPDCIHSGELAAEKVLNCK